MTIPTNLNKYQITQDQTTHPLIYLLMAISVTIISLSIAKSSDSFCVNKAMAYYGIVSEKEFVIFE